MCCILTKPLGTGILFAAAMRGSARAPWISAALDEMRCSNRSAADILVAHGANAMTDVTGFGLAGHLGEMLAASGAEAELDLAAVPLYDGALALARSGVASTLLPENLTLARLLHSEADAATQALLFDPQTAGGLLAGVPPGRAEACVAALRVAGVRAAIVGVIPKAGVPVKDGAIGLTGSLAEAVVGAGRNRLEPQGRGSR